MMATSKPSACGLAGERGDDVVGLVALDLEHRDLQGVEDLVDEADLALELVGSRGPVGLVLGVLLVRNVWRDTSKATATWAGCSSRSALMSIDVKP